MDNLRWVAALITCCFFGLGLGHLIAYYEWVRWLMIVPTAVTLAFFGSIYINKLFGVS